jgi:hypothetical protein
MKDKRTGQANATAVKMEFFAVLRVRLSIAG